MYTFRGHPIANGSGQLIKIRIIAPNINKHRKQRQIQKKKYKYIGTYITAVGQSHHLAPNCGRIARASVASPASSGSLEGTSFLRAGAVTEKNRFHC